MTFTKAQKEAAARALFERNEPAKKWDEVDHTYRSAYFADIETVIAALEKNDDVLY